MQHVIAGGMEHFENGVNVEFFKRDKIQNLAILHTYEVTFY